MPACTAFGTKSRINVTFVGFASAPSVFAACALKPDPPSVADGSAEPHPTSSIASANTIATQPVFATCLRNFLPAFCSFPCRFVLFGR
jgi:hypothetical protein